MVVGFHHHMPVGNQHLVTGGRIAPTVTLEGKFNSSKRRPTTFEELHHHERSARWLQPPLRGRRR